MARLGGGTKAPAPAPASSTGLALVPAVRSPAPASEGVTEQEEADGQALYEVLADHLAELSGAEQLAVATALQRNDWGAIPETARVLFRRAAKLFLDEGGV